MKKLIAAVILSFSLLSATGTVYAANSVSQMAIDNGRSVAECARMMDKGISECVKVSGCNIQP